MKKLIVLLLCLGLAACAHAPQSIYMSPTPTQRQQTLSHLTAWRAQGSLSIVVNGQRHMMSFDWDQSANNLFNIRFSAFTYAVMLQNHYGVITLTKPIQGINPGLFQDLTRMQFWMLGVPVPASMRRGVLVTQYDQYGHLVMLQQNGCLIQYQNYKVYSGWDMPTQVIISRQDARLRLVINRWSFDAKQERAASNSNMLLLRSI